MNPGLNPVLEVSHLKKVFRTEGKPDFTALWDVTFTLYPGEILGIVGESGSGKSTIAKSVMRLIDSTEGSISVCGKDITHRKGKDLRELYRSIQMVFQSPAQSFDPRRTLGYGIGESLKNAGVSRAEIRRKVADLLELCGLPAEFARRYPHQVSGGECQRAAIARALAISPDIIIFDEATSALDVTVQQDIMNFITSLREQHNLSYLFICHNLALVQSFCDRILVMKDGKIVEEGETDAVIWNPQSEYTKQLLAACAKISG